LSAILVWEQVARVTEDPLQLGRALDAIRASAREQLALLDRFAHGAQPDAAPVRVPYPPERDTPRATSVRRRASR
jgi:hypothetical protein